MRSEPDVEPAIVDAAEHAAATDGTEHQANATDGLQFLLDLFGDFVHRCEAGAFRRADTDIELAFIDVGRDIFLFDELVKRDGTEDDEESSRGDQCAVRHRPTETFCVSPLDPSVEP